MGKPAKKVLLVDDDEDDFIILKNLAEQVFSCEVILVWVDTFDDAIGLIDQAPPDLLVVDYDLKLDKTGLDLAGAVKEKREDLPIVLVTNHSSEAVGGGTIFDKVDAYLHKADLTVNRFEQLLRSYLRLDFG